MLIACTSILSLFSSHLCFDQFIFTLCSLPYVHFHLLSSVFPSSSRMILDFFPYFSLFYVHMEEYRSLKTMMSTEVSKLRRVQKSPNCEEYRNLQTAKRSEVSGLRKAVLNRIKRSAIFCPAREIHMSE